MNLGYVGTRMGFTYDMLYNIATTGLAFDENSAGIKNYANDVATKIFGSGDGSYIERGIDWANEGR